VGVRGGSFGRPRLCSRSQIFFPKAVGTWGKGVLSTSLSSVLASIVPGKEIWRFVVLRVVPEI
jgi:hypothetical protein